MKKILTWIILIFTGTLVFSPSFLTSMHGDEWKVIWLARNALATHGNYMPVKYWDAPYFFELATLEPLSRIIPIHSGLFYAFAFLLRLLAGYTVYKLIQEITKDKIAPYVAAFLFLISPVGIEGYIWTRNYSSYVGLIILVFIYLNILKSFSIKKLLFGFIIILLVNTIRSHGAFIFLSIILFSEFVIQKQKKKYLFTGILLTAIFLATARTKYFGGQAEVLFSAFDLKLFALNTISNIGKVFIPAPEYMRISFLAISFLLFFWKRKYIFLLLGIILYLYSYTIQTESYRSVVYAIYILGFLILTLYKEYRKTILAFAFVTSWIIIPMIRQPDVVMSNDHRYLAYSAVALPLIAAFAAKHSRFAIIPVCILVFVFSSQTFKMLSIHKNAHSTEYNDYVWKEITRKLDRQTYLSSDKIEVVADTENHSKAGASVNFGGQYHIALMYDDYRPEEELPQLFLFHGEQNAKNEFYGKYVLINIFQK